MDRHVPRPVQPHAARALPRREPAAAFQIMDTQDQLALIKRMYKRAQHRRRAISAAAAAVFHRGREGRGPAAEPGRGGRRIHAPAGRALRAVRGDVPARRRGRFRGAPAAQLRAADAATRRCASITGAASRTCWSTSSRTRTRCSTVAAAAGRAACRGFRGRRRRPVDLRVSRRQRRQHAALRARFRDAGRCRCS